jgi:hypothetical protein
MHCKAQVIAVIALMSAQAAGFGDADDKTPKVVAREVLPSATDPRIDRFSGGGWAHCVYYQPSVRKKHRLLVFLPGTGGDGHGAVDFCTVAAGRGFHVVSLAYPSTVSMSVFRASADPDAFRKARENVLYGKAPIGELDVKEPNSILNRLVRLVRFLAAKYPKEGWDEYVDGDASPLWSKLVLAGQSQGGGHAVLLAMRHEVARVLMFGSPKDFNVHFGEPARWYSGPSATPRDRFFSFVHSADEGHGCTYLQQLENYRALNLLPRYPVIDVDRTPPPYRRSRLLTSSRPVKNPHASVIANPGYSKTWTYMLTQEAD